MNITSKVTRFILTAPLLVPQATTVAPAAATAPVTKDLEKPQAEAPSMHRIRITLTSRNVRSLEKVCADLVTVAKKLNIHVKVQSASIHAQLNCIYLENPSPIQAIVLVKQMLHQSSL